MILGVGIDIVKIEKVRKALERWGKDFIDKVFNQEEIDNISKGEDKVFYQRLSARFAAKEAIIKACSSYKIFPLKDIVILNKKDGAPYCKLKNSPQDIKIFISLSHIEEYAVAFAIAEKDGHQRDN